MNLANAAHNLFVEIVNGDDTATDTSAPRRLHRSEDGMISLAVVVSMLLVTVLIGLMLNVTHTVNQKIETQNAADASTHAAGVWMARGMNSITATNHTMGELTAFVVLVHSFGGEKYDGDPPHEEDSDYEDLANTLLEVTYEIASNLSDVFQPTIPPADEPYEEVIEEEGIASGAAILDAKVQLKAVLAYSYSMHTVGMILEQIPIAYIQAIGYGLEVGALVMEWKCWQEYYMLELMEESLLKPVNELKQATIDSFLPAMMAYQSYVVVQSPLGASNAAAELAGRNGCIAELYPNPATGLRLPVEQEQPSAAIEQCQLMRASYPWMVHWREPVLGFMNTFLTVSGAAGYYEEWSHRYMAEKTDKIRSEKELHLHVMADNNLPDKGQESWTFDSAHAERLFTFVGFTQRDVSAVMGHQYFGGTHPHGIVCSAQGIVYNSNHQNRSSYGASWQPRVAWDTLNWDTVDDDQLLYEYVRGTSQRGRDDGEPKVSINWQCKLVPVTRLNESASRLSGPFGTAIQKQVPDTSYLRTH